MIGKLKALNIHAMRTANSGASYNPYKPKELTDAFKADLYCQLEGWQFSAEVKGRANDSGWKCIKDWLGNADMLFIVEDKKQPLAVIPWHIFEMLISKITPPPEQLDPSILET